MSYLIYTTANQRFGPSVVATRRMFEQETCEDSDHKWTRGFHRPEAPRAGTTPAGGESRRGTRRLASPEGATQLITVCAGPSALGDHNSNESGALTAPAKVVTALSG